MVDKNKKQNLSFLSKGYETICCNLCGSDEYGVVYQAKGLRGNEENLLEVFRSSADEFLFDQLVKCKKCGLIYVNPRLNYHTILKMYEEGEDKDFVSQAKAREKTFMKYVKMLDKYAQKGKILDVGTGSGAFLNAAKKMGWQVYGTEMSRWLCEWANKNYGINIRQGTLMQQKFPDNFFDVVTLWDVLEHMGDPKAELLEIRRILKPKGLLLVNFPDISSVLSRISKRKWWFLLSVHLYYFTPKTIEKMLNLADFSVFKVGRHFQSLNLGYLIYRFKTYNRFLYGIFNGLAQRFNAGNLLIPYYAAQKNVFCRNMKNER